MYEMSFLYIIQNLLASSEVILFLKLTKQFNSICTRRFTANGGFKQALEVQQGKHANDLKRVD